jgi:hypothetical protein
MPNINIPDNVSDLTVIAVVGIVCVTFAMTKLNAFPRIFRLPTNNKLDDIMKYLRNDKKCIDEHEERLDTNDKKWENYVLSHKALGNEIKDTKSSLSQKIDNTDSKVDNLAEMVLGMRLSEIRKDLFTDPQSKEEHENLIKEGDWYCEHGGNGVGAILLKNLKDSFKQRSVNHDWDYSHKV